MGFFLSVLSLLFGLNSATYRPARTRQHARDVIWRATRSSWSCADSSGNVTVVFQPRKMVKSGKLRSGTGSKLKRWKKGHSSDSNPQTSRFRQAAKSRFFSRPAGKPPGRLHVGPRLVLSPALATVVPFNLRQLKITSYVAPFDVYQPSQ